MNVDLELGNLIAAAKRGEAGEPDPITVPVLLAVQEMLKNQRQSVALLEAIFNKLESAYPHFNIPLKKEPWS